MNTRVNGLVFTVAVSLDGKLLVFKLCFALQRQKIAKDRSAVSCVGAVEWSPASIVAPC